MKFEWNPDKNADMNVEVDWNTSVRNPYINKFTRKEKIRAILDCMIAVEKVSKEKLKKKIMPSWHKTTFITTLYRG